MKKNININLFGTLYAIDEDACKLLENYLDNMRSYFAKREGGDEIYDDIEHRVAEHLWTLKEQGMAAIDIDTVKSVIGSIGNPAQVDDTPGADGDGNDGTDTADGGNDEDSTAHDNAAAQARGYDDDARWTDRALDHIRSHRFYRDGRDKIAGGVMSGLCHYCGGGDTLVWRVAAVLLVIVAFSLNQMTSFFPIRRVFGLFMVTPFILYIALWLLAPVARTTEERLCMKGGEVTPESLAEAVIAEAGEAERKRAARRGGGSILGRVVEILLFCIKAGGTVVFAIMSAFALAYLVCGIIYAIVGQPFLAMFEDDAEFLKMIGSIHMLGFYWIVSALCCLAASLLPLLGLVRSFRAECKPLGMAAVATLVVTWVTAVVVSILLFVLFGLQMERESDAMYKARYTRGGIFLDNWNWELLDQYGWRVSVARNIADGTLYGDNSDDPLHLGFYPICLRPEKAGVPVALAMSHKENADAGDYVLECMADCSLTDAVLSAWSGGKCVAQLRLDGYGAAMDKTLGGTSWHDSRAIPLFSMQADSTAWVREVQGMNDDDETYDNGRDWHGLASATFHHDGGMMELRISVGQHDVADGSAVCGRMWLAHVGMRKVQDAKTKK